MNYSLCFCRAYLTLPKLPLASHLHLVSRFPLLLLFSPVSLANLYFLYYNRLLLLLLLFKVYLQNNHHLLSGLWLKDVHNCRLRPLLGLRKNVLPSRVHVLISTQLWPLALMPAMKSPLQCTHPLVKRLTGSELTGSRPLGDAVTSMNVHTHANMHVCRRTAGGKGLSTTQGEAERSCSCEPGDNYRTRIKDEPSEGKGAVFLWNRRGGLNQCGGGGPVRYMKRDWKKWCSWHLFLGETVRSQKWHLVLRRIGKDSSE